MDLITQSIVDDIREAAKRLKDVPEEERIQALNEAKKALHQVSPFKDEPVDCVLWVKTDLVEANDYNPNNVAPPEMELLQLSIQEDGFTQPIVTWTREDQIREVVDGFHRSLVARKHLSERLLGYTPVTTINPGQAGRGDRIASTIRHNRARGKHQIEEMKEIVAELTRRNWSEKKIGKKLGMDPDEVLRLKQITGLAEMFKDEEFSQAWEAE